MWWVVHCVVIVTDFTEKVLRDVFNLWSMLSWSFAQSLTLINDNLFTESLHFFTSIDHFKQPKKLFHHKKTFSKFPSIFPYCLLLHVVIMQIGIRGKSSVTMILLSKCYSYST